MAPPTKRRKVKESAVEEVTFDPTARFEYLTGFHKRKVQRTKLAQEAAAKRAREEKIDGRKKLREERKADLERHVNQVNALLPSVRLEPESKSDSEDGDTNEKDDWAGLEDLPAEPVDHEAEYIDEDKYTTVTVEEVDISKDGISRVRNNQDEEKENQEADASKREKGYAPSSDQSQRLKSTSSSKRDKSKDKKIKKKKKNFRYESPAERKFSRAKVRAKNSKLAKLRKEGA